MKAEIEKCVIQAQRFLAIREHNCSELRTKLKTKSFSEEIISETIQYLLDSDYLNEERYIRSFIRANNRFHPEGKTALLKRLLLKNTDKELCYKILDKVYTEEYQDECLQRAYQKYSEKMSGNKLFDKLLSCGFNPSTIRKKLAEPSLYE